MRYLVLPQVETDFAFAFGLAWGSKYLTAQHQVQLKVRHLTKTQLLETPPMSDTTTTPPPVREKYIFYHYDPTVVGAGIFAAIFFLSAAIHLAQIVRKRTWYFIPLLVGAVRKFQTSSCWRSRVANTPNS